MITPIFLIDFYKAGHINQYPKGITQVWSNWTPRTSRDPNTKKVINFGLTYFLKKYLLEDFQKHFFDVPLDVILAEYKNVISSTLGDPNPRTDHIEWLHELGYIPLKFYSLPEGIPVAIGIPPIVVTNTKPEGFWLVNYFETLLSNILWKPSTSATTARKFRELFVKYAKLSGETDMSFVDWQGHDFSMRGMSGIEDAVLSGMGHLLMFKGTDTLPAILTAVKYYNADLKTTGGSVPATEHSVMSAGSKDGEFETFERLITEVYPAGIVSIVSDTWDLWKVLTDFVPRLKEKILARTGKVVFRPDSGDPIKIMTGDSDKIDEPNTYDKDHSFYHPAYRGVLNILKGIMGFAPSLSGALPMINGVGAIYGDAINLERAEAILKAMVYEMFISTFNMVFGIGSFTYEYVTRDTNGNAMKATAVRMNTGEIVPIFKKPVTDDGGKFSLKGIVSVFETETSLSEFPEYFALQESTEYELNYCAYEVVFEDSKLLIDPDFETIRKRARMGIE